MSPAQVTHVNAHATSTPEGDPLEARAIETVFGDSSSSVVVSATKSMTGHLLGGAGAIESVASVMALADRVAPPTINLDDLDDDVTHFDVATKSTPARAAPGRRRADGGAQQRVRLRRAQRGARVHRVRSAGTRRLR